MTPPWVIRRPCSRKTTVAFLIRTLLRQRRESVQRLPVYAFHGSYCIGADSLVRLGILLPQMQVVTVNEGRLVGVLAED